MITVIAINILNYIIQRLPHHKRKPDRITFLQILTFPFVKIWEEWETWRDRQITRAYVCNETMSLEWYLNYLFNNGGIDITIVTAQPGGVGLGIDGLSVAETAASIWLGDDTLGGAESAAFTS